MTNKYFTSGKDKPASKNLDIASCRRSWNLVPDNPALLQIRTKLSLTAFGDIGNKVAADWVISPSMISDDLRVSGTVRCRPFFEPTTTRCFSTSSYSEVVRASNSLLRRPVSRATVMIFFIKKLRLRADIKQSFFSGVIRRTKNSSCLELGCP